MYWTLKAVAKKTLLESRESDVLRDPPLAAAATSLSLLRLKKDKKIEHFCTFLSHLNLHYFY